MVLGMRSVWPSVWPRGYSLLTVDVQAYANVESRLGNSTHPRPHVTRFLGDVLNDDVLARVGVAHRRNVHMNGSVLLLIE